MTKAERLQLWIDHPDAAPAVKKKHNLVCTVVGVSAMVSNAAKSLVQAWNCHLQSSDSSTDEWCSIASHSDDESATSDENEEQAFPWYNWETFVEELAQPAAHHSFFLCVVCTSCPSASV